MRKKDSHNQETFGNLKTSFNKTKAYVAGIAKTKDLFDGLFLCKVCSCIRDTIRK